MPLPISGDSKPNKMKIKHFQGYGSVNAQKVERVKCKDIYGRPLAKLVVKVWGNHEYGLEVNDTYDVFKWLVSRFDKTIKDYTKVLDFKTECSYQRNNNCDEEVCIYTIICNAD